MFLAGPDGAVDQARAPAPRGGVAAVGPRGSTAAEVSRMSVLQSPYPTGSDIREATDFHALQFDLLSA